MSEMPARIWVDAHSWTASVDHHEGDTPFIRADIAERMAKALEAILFEDSDKNEVDCIKDRVIAVAALSAWKGGR
jgi:hypothetical protein